MEEALCCLTHTLRQFKSSLWETWRHKGKLCSGLLINENITSTAPLDTTYTPLLLFWSLVPLPFVDILLSFLCILPAFPVVILLCSFFQHPILYICSLNKHPFPYFQPLPSRWLELQQQPCLIKNSWGRSFPVEDDKAGHHIELGPLMTSLETPYLFCLDYLLISSTC